MTNEEKLKNLYQDFLKYHKMSFIKDSKIWFGVEKLKLKEKELEKIYEICEKESFLAFLKKLKDIIYLKNVFNYVLINSTELWPLFYRLNFLRKRGIISVKKNGKIVLLQRKLLKIIPPPLKQNEIQTRIEKKIKKKLDLCQPVSLLFKTQIIPQYDQMPISIYSALFLVEKILEYLPLNKRFLLVGDDDLISVFLCLTLPQIECTVIDIDNQLLKDIEKIAKNFELKIKTRKVNIQNQKKLKESYIGFLANPPYNLEGVRKFTQFGVSQLGKDGGYVFLEVGDESIGNRFLLLQNFFTKEHLIVREILKKQIFYPWTLVHKEDIIILKRMESFFDKKIIERNPKLSASFYVLEYIPWEVKKLKTKGTMTAYI